MMSGKIHLSVTVLTEKSSSGGGKALLIKADMVLKMKLRGVAEQGYTMSYGKSQIRSILWIRSRSSFLQDLNSLMLLERWRVLCR